MAWSSSDLVAALRQQVLALEADLRERVDGEDHSARQPGVWPAWESDYTAAFTAQRTAATWQQWRNERITQAAVSWVLLTVFARYCEDNALVTPRWIGGADADERTQALDARRAYFQAHPEHTDREWLGQIIDHFAKFPATAALVDSFSPLHLVGPSGDAARALLEFWWQQGDDGQPLYSFAGVDARFLGDAYQDLSEYAKKTYALLQTPDFVEEFILDQTLEPALADRPLEGFTIIDPTCGSGHFLLGAFHRLHERWQRHAPAWARVNLSRKPSMVSTASTSTPSPSPSPASACSSPPCTPPATPASNRRSATPHTWPPATACSGVPPNKPSTTTCSLSAKPSAQKRPRTPRRSKKSCTGTTTW